MSDIQQIPVGDLRPNPDNPRKQVGDVTELAQSIRQQGIRQNLLVTPMREATGPNESRIVYRIVIGHRRWTAAKQAGLETVPCAIAELTPREERELMLVENTQRTDLTPMEEADGYQGLLDLGSSVKDMAERTGRSQTFVRGRLRIASIPTPIRQQDQFAQLDLLELEALADLNDSPADQKRLAKTIGTNNFDYTRTMIARERRRRAWLKEAGEQARGMGLEIHALPGNAGRWSWHPDDCEPYPKLFDEGRRFDEQWGEWLKGDKLRERARLYEDGESLFAYQPLDPKAAARREREGAEAKSRRKRELEEARKWRQVDETSRDTRMAWLKANLPGFSGPKQTFMLERLLANRILGPYGFGSLFEGDVNRADRIVQAYNLLTTPLPVAEKDVKHDVYHLAGPENMRALADRAGKPGQRRMQLLLLLLADTESRVDADCWRGRSYGSTLADYYRLLDDIGYEASEEETKHLPRKDNE